MKVETIDKLIAEDMRAHGKTMDDMLKCIPKKRRKEFKKNVEKECSWTKKLLKYFA